MPVLDVAQLAERLLQVAPLLLQLRDALLRLGEQQPDLPRLAAARIE
jgi:hypothetical protein